MHKSIKGEITQKVLKRELSFLYATHRHDLFYIIVKYHQNFPNGFQVIERTQKCLWTDGRKAHCYIPLIFWSGDKNARVLFLVHDTLSQCDACTCKVS